MGSRPTASRSARSCAPPGVCGIPGAAAFISTGLRR
jgi:hypothetical protein